MAFRFFDRLTDSFRKLSRGFDTESHKHESKFFSADPGERVAGSHEFLHDCVDMREDRVACKMPLEVIDAFEMIEAEQDERQLSCPLDTSIRLTSKSIDDGLFADAPEMWLDDHSGFDFESQKHATQSGSAIVQDPTGSSTSFSGVTSTESKGRSPMLQGQGRGHSFRIHPRPMP